METSQRTRGNTDRIRPDGNQTAQACSQLSDYSVGHGRIPVLDYIGILLHCLSARAIQRVGVKSSDLDC